MLNLGQQRQLAPQQTDHPSEESLPHVNNASSSSFQEVANRSQLSTSGLSLTPGTSKAGGLSRWGENNNENTVDHLEFFANKNHSSIQLKKSLLSSGVNLLGCVPTNNQAEGSSKGKRPKEILNAMKTLSLNEGVKMILQQSEKHQQELRLNQPEKGNQEAHEASKERGDAGDAEVQGDHEEEEAEDNLPFCSKHANKKVQK